MAASANLPSQQLGNTATAVVLEKLTQFGLGQDMWMLEPDNITNVLKVCSHHDPPFQFLGTFWLTHHLAVVLLHSRGSLRFRRPHD